MAENVLIEATTLVAAMVTSWPSQLRDVVAENPLIKRTVLIY